MNKSFTLIEILVVIVVIGILSAFILVGMSSISSKASIAKGQVFANSLRNALLLSLISEWKMDENTGTVLYDNWKGENDGLLTNFDFNSSSGWRTGSQCVSGSCLQFDGSNDNVDFGEASNTISNKITIETWINPDLTASTADLISKWQGSGGFSLTRYLKNTILFVYSNSYYLYANDCLESNRWTQIIYTIDNSTSGSTILKSYVNGKYWSGNTRNTDIGSTSNSLTLTRYGTYGAYFKGYMDETRIYTNIASVQKINEKYYSGLNKLFKGGGIVLEEFNQRLVELKNNLANNE